ncbi:hypothetical protein [Pseudomonas maioricensis]|uniref:hypothetical protein n=1 Tax=Pseudomonas maioricensis TaxID=1766623 RepID=UPI001FAE6024|nr:hypothetical protein [Pseudomonas sp. S25]
MNDNTLHSSDNQPLNSGVMLFPSSAQEAQRFVEQIVRLGHDASHVLAGGIGAAINWSQVNPSPAVMLVDIDGDPLPLQSLSELFENCDPTCQIVTTGSRQDVDLYRTLLRNGVCDYLVKPVPFDLLAATLARAQGADQHEAHGVRNGRTIAITGASGGCGSSTVAAGLAQLLSEQRHTATAVVDFDRHNGDLALLLGYDGDAGLAGALNSNEIDSRFLQRSMGKINDRLHLLAQEPSYQIDPHLAVDHLLSLGGNLCRMFNQVIWDLPAGRPSGSMEVLAHAQTRIVLADMNVQDARNTHRLLREIGDESEGQHLLLVINPSRGNLASGVERQQFEEFVERRIDLVLPYVAQSLSNSLLTGPLRLSSAPAFQSTLLELADLACGHTPRKTSLQSGNIISRLKNVLGRSRSAA